MAMLLKRLSRLEAQMDNAIESFISPSCLGISDDLYRHPLITLTAVCLFTAAIVFPLGVFFRLDLTGAAPSFQAPQSGKAHILISS